MLLFLLPVFFLFSGAFAGDSTIAQKTLTSNNTVEVSYKETCYAELYANTSLFTVQFEKEVKLEDAHGKSVFLLDGLKKSENDVEFYFREWCYKDLNVSTHDSNTAKASIYSTKDGKVTQAFNDHSGNSTDTLNGKKVGKKDDDKKKNDAKKKDDGKDNYGKKDDGKGNGKKRRALLDLADTGSDTGDVLSGASDLGSDFGFGGDDDDDDDDDDDSVEAVSVKDDGAQRFNHHSSDAAVAHKDSRDDEENKE